MTNTRSPEMIEAEARLVRGELIASGSIVHARLSPAALVNAARTRMRETTAQSFGSFNKHYLDIGLLLTGGSIAVALMKAFGGAPERSETSASRTFSADQIEGEDAPNPASSPPSFASRFRAAMVSSLGAILGFGVSQLLPHSSVESELLGDVRTLLGQQVGNFVDAHAQGIKRSMAHSFGLSRFAAGLLVLMALAGDRTRANAS